MPQIIERRPQTDAGARGARDRALFDTIADRYARKDLSMSSRRARRLRLEQTLAAVPMHAGFRVLDAGCGAGFAARHLFGRCRSYLGIDQSEKLIEAAQMLHDVPGARFACRSIYEPLTGISVDLVLMIGVLHHLPDPEAALVRLRNALVPGGWIAVNEPQPGNPLIRLARRVRARCDESYSEEQDELSREQLTGMLSSAGFADVRIVPQGLFSTPFAEVPLAPGWLFAPCAQTACAADRVIERAASPLLDRLSWNLIALGRNPSH